MAMLHTTHSFRDITIVMLHTAQEHHNGHATHYSFWDITMIMLHTAQGHHNGHATHCSGTSQSSCYTLLRNIIMFMLHTTHSFRDITMFMLHTTHSFRNITMVMLHTTHSFKDITMIMLHTTQELYKLTQSPQSSITFSFLMLCIFIMARVKLCDNQELNYGRASMKYTKQNL